MPEQWRTVNDVDLPPGWTAYKLVWYWIGFRNNDLMESRAGDGKLLEWRRKEQH